MYGHSKPEDLPYPPGGGMPMPQPGYPIQGGGGMGFQQGPPMPPNYDQYGNQPPGPGGYYGPPQGGGYGPPQGGGGYYGPPQGDGYGYPPQGGGYGYQPQGGYPPSGGYPPPTGQIPNTMQMGAFRPGQTGSPDYTTEEFQGFTDPEVRRNFVKKVYAILSVQLAITAAIIYPFLYVDKVQEFAHDNMFVMYICLGVYMVTMLVLVCCESVRRAFPVNMVMLMLLTFAMGTMCGFITTRYGTHIVLIAFGMTAVICFIVTMIAWFAPIDITGCGTLMCILGIGLSVFGIVAMLLVSFLKLKIMILIYSAIAVVVFSLYLLFDTQQIMGGKRVELSPEEFVLGALQLYIDVIEIFLNLLPLVAACFNDD